MFGHSNYYHGVLRKYVVMFGNMFNDIDVVRYDSNGTAKQTIRVPIAYGPKEKYLARINTDPSLNRQVAVQLPRLAFEITSITYAPNRGLNKMVQNVGLAVNDENKMKRIWTPTPYDINFTLYGMFANQEDAVQVVEQILPFFRPEWTHTVNLIPEIGDKYDIPTILSDMSIEDTYEADFQTRRAIIYSFNFTVKGYLFGPIENRGVIKRTIVDLSANSTVGAPNDVRLDIKPGMYANGSPTTNAAASVAYSTISADDTWDYTFEKEDYFDGIDRHGHGS
jgi:hypothetical protein